MPWVRRSSFFFLRSIDVAAEREQPERSEASGLIAVSALTGREVPLSRHELQALLEVPVSRWVWADGESIYALATTGLVISDEDDDHLIELRRREERLSSDEWHPAAALLHFSTRRSGIQFRLPDDDEDRFAELAAASDETAVRFVERHGPPPDAFHSVGRTRSIELPLVRGEGGLYDALRRRETTRGFDRAEALTQDELSIVLYEVFGCHGWAAISEDVILLKRTSPSGGGLHPVEVYPLIRHVDGIEPGLYHYSGRDHSLELIEPVEPASGRQLLRELTCGQVYLASASVAFFLTARFYRNFWKYRRHFRGYASVLMDAAHLSQSLYLVCAELGLGAFVTSFVNGADIEERLGLDGWAEGALAVCGCGRRRPGGSAMDFEYSPYVPRESSI